MPPLNSNREAWLENRVKELEAELARMKARETAQKEAAPPQTQKTENLTERVADILERSPIPRRRSRSDDDAGGDAA